MVSNQPGHTDSRAVASASRSGAAGLRKLLPVTTTAGAALTILLAASTALAGPYRDKHGNPADVTLEPPIVNVSDGDIDYSVVYAATDSEGTKMGEYRITSQMMPGRSPTSDDFVLTISVLDDATQRAAELTYHNNADTAPLRPILRLLDCSGGTPCLESAVYDDQRWGAWVIQDRTHIEDFPIEFLDARVILQLLEPGQLAELPNTADATGNWAEIMENHRTNFEETKFRGDIDNLGDSQNALITASMMWEIADKDGDPVLDWRDRHVDINHNALSFLIGHRDLIETDGLSPASLTEVLQPIDPNTSMPLPEWPTTGEYRVSFPFGRMPIWLVDPHEEPGDPFHELPDAWQQVFPTTLSLGTPACFHDWPDEAYLPSLEDLSDSNIGQWECATNTTANGFVDRQCTVDTDYSPNNVGCPSTEDSLRGVVECNWHNGVHGTIQGAFGSVAQTAGTMVFWAFHTYASTVTYSNWKHAQKRDMGIAQRSCEGGIYQAESMTQSTGGAEDGGWNIWSDGYIETSHGFSPGPSEITVRARGVFAAGEWPHMVVSVDGDVIGDVYVDNPSWSDYAFPFSASGGIQDVRVEFDNDFYDPGTGQDRNLLVDYVVVACVGCQPYEAEGMTQSTGEAVDEGWNIYTNGNISTEHIFASGLGQLTVTARGESALGVWPHMIVRVDGAVVGDLFVEEADWTDYTFPYFESAGPKDVVVEFDNDYFDAGSGEDRNLHVDRVIVGCPGEEPGAPCASFCADPQTVTWTETYNSPPLGTGEVCIEVLRPVAGGNCGNLAGGRELFVNGNSMVCNDVNWASVPAPEDGGYCIHTTAGPEEWAYLTLW